MEVNETRFNTDKHDCPGDSKFYEFELWLHPQTPLVF